MSTTPGSVTTPLAAGHAYEITVSKADVANLSAQGQDAASDAWDAIDGLLNGGVTANADGTPTPGSQNVGSDMSDGGDVWVATVTPGVATSIGGATALFPTVSYSVVDVSGNPAQPGGGVGPVPAPASSGIFAKVVAALKAHPVAAAVAAGLALVFVARPMRKNPHVRRARSALRF